MPADLERTLRLATPGDNAACLDLFGAVPMRGDLVLATQRDPDFFGLYAMQKAQAFTWVGEDAHGKLVGMASALIRDGWLDGTPARVGYLGDLRVRFDRARTFGRVFGDRFDELCAQTGCSAYYTSILSSNRAALHALTRPNTARPNQPHYQPLRRFDAVSVQLTRGRAPRTSLRVRSATPADVPQLTEALALTHQDRAFGYRFDDGELEHRLAHWPGFRLEDTLLVHDAGGRLLGAATVWDPSPVKRYRVLAYRGALRWAQLGFNLAARLARWPRLPAPGNVFRAAYLTNLFVRDERPDVLHALLEHAYARLQPHGFHFFTLGLDEGDPLESALKGFRVQRLGFTLFAVTPGRSPRRQWPSGRTGFEIALA